MVDIIRFRSKGVGENIKNVVSVEEYIQTDEDIMY